MSRGSNSNLGVRPNNFGNFLSVELGLVDMFLHSYSYLFIYLFIFVNIKSRDGKGTVGFEMIYDRPSL
jgi:hypothetical protein